MTAARSRVVAAVVTVLVLAAAALLFAAGGDEPYRLDAQLQSANGLRHGSLVKVGGAKVGTISEIQLDDRDRVIAHLELDKDRVAPRSDAAIRVVTSNLLGSKFLQLDTGSAAAELPSGSSIAKVTYPTDLDQVLDVVDTRTRARLAVLVNEAGYALTGRKTDFNQALGLLPRDLASAQRLLSGLVADNHTLGDALTRTSTFVTALNGRRAQLNRVVDNAGATLTAIAGRRDELRSTLQEAPATLRQLDGFLQRLQQTTEPLGPAADAITAAAPRITETLDQVPAFQRAADPALRQATATAPLLTDLGNDATPVVRAAAPTAKALAHTARTLPPISHGVRISIDNVLGVLEGWGRSVQDRDGLGHYFRGYATVTPDIIRAAVDSLVSATAGAAPASRKDKPKRRPAAPPSTATSPDADGPADKQPQKTKPLDPITGLLQKVLRPPAPEPKPSTGQGENAVSSLLDYLLKP